jgi:hypothetical protein
VSILGKPIHVCPHHVGRLPCGCMGVLLNDKESLDASAPERRDTCAFCAMAGLQDGWRRRRLLRKCRRGRCSEGRYRTEP